MSFQPILPFSGYSGWSFLTRTIERQKDAHTQSAPIKRATDYFRENIEKATTAEALVKDRRLLQVALGAFGLEDDINAKAFIRKVLEDGTIKSDALSSRLADKRYAQFAFTFGYGNVGARVNLTGFADQIIKRYEDHQFEVSVGEQDGAMRQALNLETAIGDILGNAKTTNAQWYSVMGNPSLRDMFQTALGLPSSFASIDIDQQLTTFKERSERVFGTDRLADFVTPAKREELIRMFLVRSEVASGNAGYSPAQMALTLLQG